MRALWLHTRSHTRFPLEEHLSVAQMSQHFLETQRRYNYVTPKSFLELISFFKYLLGNKQADLQRLIDRLDVGLSTLRKTSQDVTELQKDLKITMEKVEEKKIATDQLIEEMKVSKADAQVQEEAAQLEAEKANEEPSATRSIICILSKPQTGSLSGRVNTRICNKLYTTFLSLVIHISCE